MSGFFSLCDWVAGDWAGVAGVAGVAGTAGAAGAAVRRG